MTNEIDIKEAVRDRYAGHATRSTSCCAPATACGCGGGSAIDTARLVVELGYDPADLAEIPEGANLGLGCGNPLALLALQPGETVLDLGSGGGIDCFLAAKRVGPAGRVIGVDMTPEMVAVARRNAEAGGYHNVDFRLGEIEHLPVADGSVDAIISNCVVNLVPNKRQVFRDAYRVLKSGGRLSVSDIVVLGEIPVVVRESVDAYVACLSGAILRDDYLAMLTDAGFVDVEVTGEQTYDLEALIASDLVEEYAKHTGVGLDELRRVASLFQSIRVHARKP